MTSVPPPSTPLIREINSSLWSGGILHLESHPEKDRICVYTHHVDPEYKWEYFVVRTESDYAYETWLNGQRVS
jgi:hypothetical protein